LSPKIAQFPLETFYEPRAHFRRADVRNATSDTERGGAEAPGSGTATSDFDTSNLCLANCNFAPGTGAAGQINGTTSNEHSITGVGIGSGVYSLGAAGQIEFGLRISF
jgi:hypothetical protein